MRRFRTRETRCLSNAFYYLTAATALASVFQPGLGWMGRLAILATPFAIVVVHELGHVVVARLTGRRVVSMVAKPWEGCTVVSAPNPKNVSWILVALAGSVFATIFAGVLLTLMRHGDSLGELTVWLRLVCIVSIVESAGNLLPFGELDGERVHSTIRKLRAERVARSRAKVVLNSGIRWDPELPTSSPRGVFWALSFLNEAMEHAADTELEERLERAEITGPEGRESIADELESRSATINPAACRRAACRGKAVLPGLP
jgi:hypothetical protein